MTPRFAICCALLSFSTTAVAGRPDMALRFDVPAPSTGADWEKLNLPIGNGALGAMVGGNVVVDRLQFNEKTLWTGGPSTKGSYEFGNWAGPRPGALAGVQARLANGQSMKSTEVAAILGRPVTGYGSYQNFGDLVMTMARAQGPVSDYRRVLALDDGVATVRYRQGGVSYRRDYFASYPGGVIVVRLTADRPGRIRVTAGFDIPANRSTVQTAAGGRISIAGALADNGLRYESQVQVLNHGGKREDRRDGTVRVTGADSVVLILGAGTDYASAYPRYRGADPHAGVSRRVGAAAALGYAAVLARHQADYRALFGRVRLDIGQVMPDVPIDRALAAYRANGSAADRAIEALYFQYGRYLLLASSRRGSLPANLQGVWNNSDAPPWEADYHLNINLQMNYWLADVTNLSEAGAPLYEYIDSLVAPGRATGKLLFGSSEWVSFLNVNAYGYTGVIAYPDAFWFPESAAWLATQYYDHYRFSRDAMFLRSRAYPLLREISLFWSKQLVVDRRDGTLLVSPSFSPEHGDFTAGAAMSQQIVHQLLGDAADAARTLGDAAFLREVTTLRARVDPGLRIGRWGQLQEWKADLDDPKDEHRHVSQLFALYPGDTISDAATPALADAARKTLAARGDGGTGWSMAWKIAFWARLHDGAHAHRMFTQLLRESTYPNLLDVCPPFQIDGNFGGTAGVAEMLLQSQDDKLHLLPAVPPTWRDGSIRGLRARGALTVDIAWRGGVLTGAVVKADIDGPVTIAAPLPVRDATTGKAVACHADDGGCTFAAVRGRTYRLG